MNNHTFFRSTHLSGLSFCVSTLVSGPPHTSTPFETKGSFQSLLDTCLHHTLPTKGVWWYLLVSQLPQATPRSSRCSLPSARSIPRKHANLLVHSPMLVQFFLRCLGSKQWYLLPLPQLFRGCCFTAHSSNTNSCCVSCKSPSVLGLFVELLLHFLLLPQSVLYPKKISIVPFNLYFSFVLPADPFGKVHLNTLASFFISILSSPFGCVHLFGAVSVHLLSLICTSCCISTASVLLCGPAAAALTLRQFCLRIERRKSHFPNLPSLCLALGRLSLHLFFFSFFLSSFSSYTRFFHLFLFLCFTFIFFFFFFWFLSLLFSSFRFF